MDYCYLVFEGGYHDGESSKIPENLAANMTTLYYWVDSTLNDSWWQQFNQITGKAIHGISNINHS
jgi:hypothetical protein